MRISAVAAVAALLVTPVATPARATGAGVLRCWMNYEEGRGDCSYAGSHWSSLLADAPMKMAFSANNNCPTQTISGTLSGSGIYATFVISRIGQAGVASFQGSFRRNGLVSTIHPCPVSGEEFVVTFGG